MGNDKVRELVHEYAVDNMNNGLNCAESVYDALIRAGALEGVDPDTRAMAIGFGGGIGLSGYTCGALTSCIMATGAVHGRKDPWAIDPETRKKEIQRKHYRRYNNIVHDFEKLNDGVVTCREICESQGGWKGENRSANCRRIVGSSAQLAYDYITMPAEEGQSLPYGDNMVGLE